MTRVRVRKSSDWVTRLLAQLADFLHRVVADRRGHSSRV